MDRTAWVLGAVSLAGLAFNVWWIRKRFGVNVAKAAKEELSQPVSIRTPLIVVLALILLGATIWAGAGIPTFEKADDFVIFGVLLVADLVLMRALVKRWQRWRKT